MFNYISGAVAELLPSAAIIDCGGVGFHINTSAYTMSQLQVGEKAKLFTYVHIREEIFEIYGFFSRSEKHCFEMLLGVSGVGPRAAISILSVLTPENLVMAIISEDERAIVAAPGIGKKIAQRIILELKDKMSKETDTISFAGQRSAAPAVGGDGSKLSDATAALMVLGYSPAEINTALKKVDVTALTLEELIKAALKQMMK